MNGGREINAAIPVTVLLLVSVILYGFYDNLSGEDEGLDKDLVEPVWDYEHDSESGYGSVTGGFVYRGQNVPELYGKYVYGDFIMGKLWSLEIVDGNPVNELIYDSKQDTSLTGNPRISISSFGESEDGELFFTDRNTGRIFTFNQTDSGVIVESFKPDISIPLLIGLYNAGDSSNRLFGIEQTGRIHAIGDSDQTDIFLDISERVESTDWEQGLLGLAFHPDFGNNGIFFVTYTTYDDGTLRLSKFTEGSEEEKILLEVEQPYANHNGGHIAFGPDGYLYFGLGDGGKYNDAFDNAQNLETLKGSILRLDVDGEAYSFPRTILSPVMTWAIVRRSLHMASGTPGCSALTGRPVTCGQLMWARMNGRRSISSCQEGIMAGPSVREPTALIHHSSIMTAIVAGR